MKPSNTTLDMRLSFRVSQLTAASLADLAARRDRTMSEELRAALASYQADARPGDRAQARRTVEAGFG